MIKMTLFLRLLNIVCFEILDFFVEDKTVCTQNSIELRSKSIVQLVVHYTQIQIRYYH